MSTFADNKGRTWSIDLTFGSICRVKKETGVDLLTLHNPDSPALNLMQEDSEKLLAVLLALVGPQLRAKGIAEEEFVDSLLEEHVLNAVEALMLGMVDYYPPEKQAVLKPLMRKVLGAARNVRDRQTATLRQAVAGVNLDELGRQVEEAIEQSISGSSTGGSPASSAAIPTR